MSPAVINTLISLFLLIGMIVLFTHILDRKRTFTNKKKLLVIVISLAVSILLYLYILGYYQKFIEESKFSTLILILLLLLVLPFLTTLVVVEYLRK